MGASKVRGMVLVFHSAPIPSGSAAEVEKTIHDKTPNSACSAASTVKAGAKQGCKKSLAILAPVPKNEI